MNVYVVISKRTGIIMSIYKNYKSAAIWGEKFYTITEYPVFDL